MPSLRAISVATAIGDVGSFAISSSITETGCMISKPFWAICWPIRPSAMSTTSRATGAQRRFESRAVVTWASGRISAERMARV